MTGQGAPLSDNDLVVTIRRALNHDQPLAPTQTALWLTRLCDTIDRLQASRATALNRAAKARRRAAAARHVCDAVAAASATAANPDTCWGDVEDAWLDAYRALDRWNSTRRSGRA